MLQSVLGGLAALANLIRFSVVPGGRCFGQCGMPTTFFSSLKITTSTMSAATDKARFFLEQSVPELKEYERKKLFTKVGFCAGDFAGLAQ